MSQKCQIDFFKSFWRTSVLFVGSLIPLLWLQVTPGFQSKDKVPHLRVAYVQQIPEIHLWCNNCWPLVFLVLIQHIPDGFRYTLTVRRAQFNHHFEGFTPERWFHVVFNYIGPREDEGYRIYHDGVEVTDGPGGIASQPGFRSPARRYTEQGGQYTSLRMDELLFHNRPLTDNEIEVLSQ